MRSVNEWAMPPLDMFQLKYLAHHKVGTHEQPLYELVWPDRPYYIGATANLVFATNTTLCLMTRGQYADVMHYMNLAVYTYSHTHGCGSHIARACLGEAVGGFVRAALRVIEDCLIDYQTMNWLRPGEFGMRPTREQVTDAIELRFWMMNLGLSEALIYCRTRDAVLAQDAREGVGRIAAQVREEVRGNKDVFPPQPVPVFLQQTAEYWAAVAELQRAQDLFIHEAMGNAQAAYAAAVFQVEKLWQANQPVNGSLKSKVTKSARRTKVKA